MEKINEQKNEKQMKNLKNTAIIIAVLLLASVILNVVFMVRNKNITEANKELTTEKEVVISEKEAVVESRDNFKDQLEKKRIEAIELEQKIRELEEEISRKDRSIAQLRRDARDAERLEKLKKEHENLQEEHDDLKEQYTKLQEEIEELNQKLENLQGEYDALFEKAKQAETLKAYNIFVRHKQFRFIFSDRYVDRARRVDNSYVSFEVDGSIFTEEGEKVVHMLLIDPNGNIMYPGSETFEIDDEAQKQFTVKREIEYKGVPVMLNYDIEHTKRLDDGTYSVEVYIDGKLTRKKEFVLE